MFPFGNYTNINVGCPPQMMFNSPFPYNNMFNPSYNMFGGMSTSLIGYPGYNNYGYNPYSQRSNWGGVAGGALGAGFGGMLGLGLSSGNPGWGLFGTLAGAGLGFLAGRNMY